MNQSSEVQQSNAQQLLTKLAGNTAAVRLQGKRIFSTMQRVVFALGLIALVTLCAMFFKPDLADKLVALSPFDTSLEEEVLLHDMPLANLFPESNSLISNTAMTYETEPSAQQTLVTNWLAKRYRVAGDAIDMLVSTAYTISKEVKIDPLLILSVIAIESRFNPFAESPMGAQGLMQVMTKVHHDKYESLGGVQAALNPVANIKVGSLILKEYIGRAGSIEGGLKMYVGAADMRTDGGYGAKVLSEYLNLKTVSSGKKVSILTSNTAKRAVSAAAPVATTATATPKLTANEHQNNQF